MFQKSVSFREWFLWSVVRRSEQLEKRLNCRGQCIMRNNLLKSFALGMLLVATAEAATNTINFNTDPQPGLPPALYRDNGNGEWRPSGGASGAANDGYLSV